MKTLTRYRKILLELYTVYAEKVVKKILHWLKKFGKLIVLVLILINLVSLLYPQSIFEKAKTHEDRLTMAQELLKNNDYENAKKQLKQYKNKQESRYLDLWQKATEPERIKEEIIKYEKIVEIYPDYRDAWFKLAELYEIVLQKDKAKNALATATKLDPNYQLLNK